MAELKIIGVRRVEALLSVLDAKEKQAVKELVIPTFEEVNAMVDAEFGLTEARRRTKELSAQLNEALEVLNEATGTREYVITRTGHSENVQGAAYKKRREEVIAQLRDKPVADVKAAFEAKRTQLWMCETLEEAKAIVGVA